MKSEQLLFLEHTAYTVRISSILATTAAGSGHMTSCLSAADVVVALFFYAMQYDVAHHNNPNNDRFILSKGHAAPVLYAIYKELGILTQRDLVTLRKFDSVLEGHPTPRFAYTEAATGSLGQGLSIGVGMAYAAKMDRRDYTTYVLLGDMEVSEGSVWEATEIAAYYKLNNLIGIIDCNRLGQSTHTMDEHHVAKYAHKFAAFGWHTIIVDGHDMQAVCEAFDAAKKIVDKPSMIIAKTYKGYGVDFVENKEGFHGKALNKQECTKALEALHERFKSIADAPVAYHWKPIIPPNAVPIVIPNCALPQSLYAKDSLVATRKAYGQALATLGDVAPHVVSLDAEVKNSTYAELFEKKHKDRFVQCFIAEQNMVGMGIGMAARGKVPFISTFASFFSRAFDQIRMAAIGRSPLRLVGSHAGVSIGQDGPSQMGLEDIAMMRTLPNSVVLYPCDAVSTHALVGLMANYHNGISYLRTTRMETPVIYDNNHEFSIGGCMVLRQSERDSACIIAAGITVFEALKAYDILKQDGITIAIIDLYSIKPLDAATLIAVAQKANKKIITVEDHYVAGGLGEAVLYAVRNHGFDVTCLAVTQLPRSGEPDQLLVFEQIDAHAIIKAVRNIQ